MSGTHRDIELSIVMPCLNEAETVSVCVAKAKEFLRKNDVKGEVIVADNGSTDGSQELAWEAGARVIDVETRGYGAAIRGGVETADGKYVIVGDADDSYDFLHLEPFLAKLREGYELVMGNRFTGGIEDGAMPPLHRWLGNPVLSWLGRVMFHSRLRDWHCGLRGFDRDAVRDLCLRTTGMEYASEMVAQAELNGLRVCEVPTTLSKDGRSKPPHLRSWSDGWRHLKFLLMHAPDSLFVKPGLALVVIGLLGLVPLLFGDLVVGGVEFGVHTMLYFAAALVCGVTACSFGLLVKRYARKTGFIPDSKQSPLWEFWTVDKALVTGCLCIIVGIALSIVAVTRWSSNDFGDMVPESLLRTVIPATTSLAIGVQLLFTAFLGGVMRIGISDE